MLLFLLLQNSGQQTIYLQLMMVSLLLQPQHLFFKQDNLLILILIQLIFDSLPQLLYLTLHPFELHLNLLHLFFHSHHALLLTLALLSQLPNLRVYLILHPTLLIPIIYILHPSHRMNGLTRTLRYTCLSVAKFSPLETKVDPLRNQLTWRARNLGMRELDLIVGNWAIKYLPEYKTMEELHRFNDEVLGHETPELLKKIMGQLPIEEKEHVIKGIREFALDSRYSKIDNI